MSYNAQQYVVLSDADLIPQKTPKVPHLVPSESTVSLLDPHLDNLRGGEIEIPHDRGFSWRKLWSFTGPGWLMSIAYLDPGNLESDLQCGAVAGYSLIWVLFWATFLGLIFQCLAARLGVITGRDLAHLCRQEFSRPVAMVLWIMTEIAIIGSDIQEVVGSAVAMNLLFGLPLYAGVLITAADTFTFMLIHYFGVRKLEALFATLISIMAICFGVAFGIGKPDGKEIVVGLVVPKVQDNTLLQAVGMLGAVIMPHNLFLHSSLVLSRAVDHTKKEDVKEANKYFTIEAAISLAVSFVINLFVVAVFAKGFYHGHGRTDIGLKNAGTELEKVFGHAARTVWGIGLLAAGQSSTMTGTFAGQFVMQGFLKLKIAPWKRTMFTRSVALVPALAVALVSHRHFDSLSEYLNALQSIQLPFALLPVLIFNCHGHIVGPFKLKRHWQHVVSFLVLFVILTNIYLVVVFAKDHWPHVAWMYVSLVVGGSLYLGFLFYLAVLGLRNRDGHLSLSLLQ